MEWKDLTIEQAQYIYQLAKTATDEYSVFEVQLKALSYLTGTPEEEINSWGIEHYKRELENISFMYEPIPEQKAKQRFTVKGQRYRVNYDMKQVSYGTYNEVMKFSQGEDGVIINLHRLMASIVTPVNIFGKKLKKDHEKVSEDMLQAPFLECYSAAVFFWKVYKEFLKVSQDYLMSELVEKGMQTKEARETVAALLAVMDGFTPQKS